MLITAAATAVAVGVHIGTYHFESHGYNDFNPGVYVRVDNVQVGTYYNSHRRGSVYLAYSINITDNVDVLVGGVTGYNKTATPLVTVAYKFTNGLRIGLIPSSPKGGSGGLHVAYEKPWR
jgi:hypothetical protein